jgi:hypothetical protein
MSSAGLDLQGRTRRARRRMKNTKGEGKCGEEKRKTTMKTIRTI